MYQSLMDEIIWYLVNSLHMCPDFLYSVLYKTIHRDPGRGVGEVREALPFNGLNTGRICGKRLPFEGRQEGTNEPTNQPTNI